MIDMKKLLSFLLILTFMFAFGCSKMQTETLLDSSETSGTTGVIPEEDLFFCGNWTENATDVDGTEYVILLELGTNGKAVYKYGLPASELVEYYEGEWSVKEGLLCFDLRGGFVSSEGNEFDESAPVDTEFKASFEWEMGGESLILHHYDGNNFLEGSGVELFAFESMA